MNKQWETVYTHKGYCIQILNGATREDGIGYRIKNVQKDELFNMVQDAIDFINELSVK